MISLFLALEFNHKFLCFLSYADRACKGTVRRSNLFNSDVIIAAGESSKTDTRQFIEKQQQLLDDFKKPGFSEAAYSEYVAIDKDGNEVAWKSYSNVGEYGMFVHWNSSPLVLCCGVQL